MLHRLFGSPFFDSRAISPIYFKSSFFEALMHTLIVNRQLLSVHSISITQLKPAGIDQFQIVLSLGITTYCRAQNSK